MTPTVKKVDYTKSGNIVAPKWTPIKTPQTFNYEISTPLDIIESKRYWNDAIKGQLLDVTQKAGIKPYTPTLLKTPAIAIAKSQQHLIDMLKYFEGDRNNNYEAHSGEFDDGYGNATRGFGATNDKSVNQKNAYEKMCKDIEQRSKDIKKFLNKKIGKGTYENLPSSIKEALIDYCYNSGVGTLKKSPKLLDAIKNNNYTNMLANLATVYARNKKGNLEESSGLYKRSLSRLILASRDLVAFKKQQADREIDIFYKKAKNFFKRNNTDSTELDYIYAQYKNPETVKLHPNIHYKSGDRSNATVVQNKQAKNPQKNNNENFLTRTWKSIKNFFLGLFGKNSNKTIERIKGENEQGKTSFQTMLENGSVERQGDTQVVTKDYQVLQGDTLWDISKNYGMSVGAIQNGNKINNANKIKSGENLNIQKIGYKVKNGDTLSCIAKKFGLNVKILKEINNIKDKDVIKEGRMLEIPGVIYTVKKGQTLSGIAKETGLSMEKIMKINNLTSDKIMPNQKLKIIYSKGS